MKRGQTIVAEREQAESDSERMLARKRQKQKHVRSVVIAMLMLAILGLLAYLGAKELVEQNGGSVSEMIKEEKQIKAQVIDEAGNGKISTRTKEYIIQLEEDLKELGYDVVRVTLPVGLARTLYVDIELHGQAGYFKVNMDRDAAVTAEDMARMVEYMQEKDLHPEYIDVRLEGKAYYK